MNINDLRDKMRRDTVTLVKENGKQIEGIKAAVQKEKIFINDGLLPIEEGDRFIRTLPNGMKESYLVLDRGYFDEFAGIDAHYQCDVQKESSQRFKQWASTVNYNFSGHNSRVNIGSIDNSTNNINQNSSEVIQDLKAVLEEHITNNKQLVELKKLLDEMEQTQGSPSFAEKYKKFIEVSASHISILAPFIPALTKLF